MSRGGRTTSSKSVNHFRRRCDNDDDDEDDDERAFQFYAEMRRAGTPAQCDYILVRITSSLSSPTLDYRH